MNKRAAAERSKKLCRQPLFDTCSCFGTSLSTLILMLWQILSAYPQNLYTYAQSCEGTLWIKERWKRATKKEPCCSDSLVPKQRLERWTPTMWRWCSNQLSYLGVWIKIIEGLASQPVFSWCAVQKSNLRPPPCQGDTLTNWANSALQRKLLYTKECVLAIGK